MMMLVIFGPVARVMMAWTDNPKECEEERAVLRKA